MVNQNFTLTQGNSLQFRLNIIDAEEPDEIYLICKDKSSDTTPVFQLSLEEGITKVEDENSYDFYISSEVTDTLQLLNYIYQISIEYGSDYETVVEGKLVITPEV